jgi:predicted Zn finger-like uncharacterized protein
MDVTCPACSAHYLVNDEKVRGKTARMRCRSCETVWLVAGPPGDRPGPSSEERRAAVVRRGAERERRDLFASRPLDTGSVRQTLRPPPGAGGFAAARNENSVLFTVDSLRAGAQPASHRPPPAAAAPTARPGDDSEGVIDLNGLAVSRGNAYRPPQLYASEPPPGAFAREVGASQAHLSTSRFSPRMRMVGAVLGAAAALVLCGLGLAHTFASEEPAVITAAPPPPPPVVVTYEGATTEASHDDASADKAETPASKSASAPVKSTRSSTKGRASKSGKATGTITSKTPPPAPKKPPKAADPCGCKGNLDCILRCTVNGK